MRRIYGGGSIRRSLRAIEMRGIVPCKLFALGQDGRTDHHAQSIPVLDRQPRMSEILAYIMVDVWNVQ